MKYCKTCKKEKDNLEFGIFKTCSSCREKDKIIKKNRKNKNIPEGKKICQRCLVIKDFNDFLNNNKNCNRCLGNSKKSRIKTDIINKKLAKESEGSLKFCSSCRKSIKIKDFISPFTSKEINICKNCSLKGKEKTKKYFERKSEKIKELKTESKFEKLCTVCLKIKSKEHFQHQQVLEGETTNCLECRVRLNFTIYKSRFKKVWKFYLQLRKENSQCLDCKIDDYRLIEFHHLDPNEKKFNLFHAPSVDKLYEEYKKCIALCGICHRRRTKEMSNRPRLTNNAKYITDLKRNKKCTNCEWYDEKLLEALEFDHIDRKLKLYNISRMKRSSFSMEDINKEVSKCRLLCVNCHKLRTINQMGYNLYIFEANIS